MARGCIEASAVRGPIRLAFSVEGASGVARLFETKPSGDQANLPPRIGPLPFTPLVLRRVSPRMSYSGSPDRGDG